MQWAASKLGPATKKPEWPDSSWIRFAIPDCDSTQQCFREDGESEQVDLTAELECLWVSVSLLEEPTNEPLRCNGKWGDLFISPELWTFVTDQVLLIDWTLLSMESTICLRLFLLFMLRSFPETCLKVNGKTVHLEGLKPLNTLVFIDDLNPIIVLLTKEFSLVHSANCSALGFGFYGTHQFATYNSMVIICFWLLCWDAVDKLSEFTSQLCLHFIDFTYLIFSKSFEFSCLIVFFSSGWKSTSRNYAIFL